MVAAVFTAIIDIQEEIDLISHMTSHSRLGVATIGREFPLMEETDESFR